MTDSVSRAGRARGTRGSRTLGSLLRDVLPELRTWILHHRGIARLGNESTRDLLQSVCREALAARAGFEDRGDIAFRAWMRRLTDRKLADRARYWSAQRRETARRRALPQALDGAPLVAEQATPEERASDRELTRFLLERIAQLPAAQRAVLELQVREQLSTAEIARRLDKSELAVRLLRCRALAALGRALDPSAP